MTTFNTGNPIGSTDARDRLDNSENMDILENSTTLTEHADRLGTIRKTRKGMEDEHDAQIAAHEAEFIDRILKMAFTPVGTFTAGATLTDARQTLLWEVSEGGDGHYYSWSGSFGTSGKVVAAGSSPSPIAAGSWVDRTDDSLRYEIRETVFQNMKRLAAEAGFNLVDGSFEEGASLSGWPDVVWCQTDGKYYQWHLDEAKTVPAGSTPAGGGFVDQSGNITVSVGTYALLRSYAGSASKIRCLGRSNPLDGAFGLFVLDTTDTSTPDDDATVLVGVGGKRWKRVYSGSKMLTWAGVEPGTDVTSALQNAINVGGGELLIKDGVYSSGKVTIDRTGLYPSLGNPSTRFDLVGSSLGNTIFKVSDSFLEYIGYDGTSTASQGTHTGMTIKDFSVVGTGNVGYGIRIKNAAFAHISNLYFKDLEIGMRLSGALTSYYNQIHSERNNYGVYIGPDSYSNVNAVRFSGIFHNNSKAGIGGTVGANIIIEDSNFEGCGTDGVSSTGGIILECNERMSTINISAYFEGNMGVADIKINNPTASILIVNLRGCSFIRGNSDGSGCLSNIDLSSSGGGQIILNLMGCSFYTKTSGGYVPSVDKPFIKPYPHLIVNGEETCFFNESTSRANTGNSGGVLGLTMKADGTCANPPLYLQSRRDAVGEYFLDRMYSYSYDVDHLQVVAVSRTFGAQLHYITKLNPSAIRLRFVDFSGAPKDADFDVMITARK